MVRVAVPDGEDHTVYVLARLGAPALVAARSQMLKSVFSSESTLSPREREGMRMVLAAFVGCTHCLKIRMARDMPGFSPEPIPEDFYEWINHADSWHGYSARERLAMRFAEHFAKDAEGLQYDDNLWADIHAHFNDHEVADLCLLSGTWVGAGLTMKVLGLGDVCDTGGGGQPQRKLDQIITK